MSYNVTGVGGKPRLLNQRCTTCILGGEQSITPTLRAGRLKSLIDEARRNESYVVCHSTFDAQPAICRGFYEAYSTNSLRICERLGGFDEIDPPRGER
jgi:hypothetical protein